MARIMVILFAVILLEIIPATAFASAATSEQADGIEIQRMQDEPIIGKEAQIIQKKAKSGKDDLVVENAQVKQTNSVVNTNLPTEQNIEHEGKVQHIRNVFYKINAKEDYQIVATDTNRNYIDNGVLIKSVFVNDINNLTLPSVECYYENNLLIFAYGKDGVNEYRYYFENGNLIREVGADNIIIDYPNGDGFLKTADPKAAQIYGRGQWEAVLVAEGYYSEVVK